MIETNNKLKTSRYYSDKAKSWLIVTVMFFALVALSFVIKANINTNYKGFSSSTFCECGTNLCGDEKYCPKCGESTANVILKSNTYCENCDEHYTARYKNCKKCGKELTSEEVTKSVKELGYRDLADLSNSEKFYTIVESFMVLELGIALFCLMQLVTSFQDIRIKKKIDNLNI